MAQQVTAASNAVLVEVQVRTLLVGVHKLLLTVYTTLLVRSLGCYPNAVARTLNALRLQRLLFYAEFVLCGCTITLSICFIRSNLFGG